MKTYFSRFSVVAVAAMGIMGLGGLQTGNAATAISSPSIVRPAAPYPLCGDHFTLTRSGTTVRITGVDLKAFSKGYMSVFASTGGKGYGPYPASPYGGANFTISTSGSGRTDIYIALTDNNNTVTYCAQTYYA